MVVAVQGGSSHFGQLRLEGTVQLERHRDVVDRST